MTLFGTLWNKLLADGQAPRESLFAEQHSDQWHAARRTCREQVTAFRQTIKTEQRP